MTIRYRNPAVLIFNCSLKQTNVRPASAIIARKDGGAERLILGINLFHIKSCVQGRFRASSFRRKVHGVAHGKARGSCSKPNQHVVNVTPMCDGLLPSLDSTAFLPPGAMPSTSGPSLWSRYSEMMSFKIPEFYRDALLVRTSFKAEHLPVVWSRVLYRARLVLPDG